MPLLMAERLVARLGEHVVRRVVCLFNGRANVGALHISRLGDNWIDGVNASTECIVAKEHNVDTHVNVAKNVTRVCTIAPD